MKIVSNYNLKIRHSSRKCISIPVSLCVSLPYLVGNWSKMFRKFRISQHFQCIFDSFEIKNQSINYILNLSEVKGMVNSNSLITTS